MRQPPESKHAAIVVGCDGLQTFVGVAGFGEPPAALVEDAELEERIGNDAGLGIGAADMIENARIFLFLAALEKRSSFLVKRRVDRATVLARRSI